ncbi:MAG: RlmE family RNA methyltransferase [Sphaerochaeta sp.]
MAKSRRDRADSYTLKARAEGYPARSVYKLEEMQQHFKLIKAADAVLDVGAAPGSWTLYVQRKLLKGRGRIVAVDLNPLSLSPQPDQVTELVGDAFSEEIRQTLIALGPYDVIISDAAPQTSGIRSVDTSRSEALCESVIALAEEQLKVGGNLVVKLFQGGGQAELVSQMRALFERVKPYKPKACRDDSFEVYLVGLGRRQ